MNCRTYKTTPWLSKYRKSKSNRSSCTVITKKGKIIYKLQHALQPETIEETANPIARSIPDQSGKTVCVQASKPKPSVNADDGTRTFRISSLPCKESPGNPVETLANNEGKTKTFEDIQKPVVVKLTLPQFTDTSLPNSRVKCLLKPKIKKSRSVEVRKVLRESNNLFNRAYAKGPKESTKKSFLTENKSFPELLSNDLYNFCSSNKSGKVSSSNKSLGAFVELRPKRIRFSSKEMVYPNIGKQKKRNTEHNTQKNPNVIPAKPGKSEDHVKMKTFEVKEPRKIPKNKSEFVHGDAVNADEGLKVPLEEAYDIRVYIEGIEQKSHGLGNTIQTFLKNTTSLNNLLQNPELNYAIDGCKDSMNNMVKLHMKVGKPGEGCVRGASKKPVPMLEAPKPRKVRSVHKNENLTIHKHPVHRPKKASSEGYETVKVIEKDGKTITKMKPKKGKVDSPSLPPKASEAVFMERPSSKLRLLQPKNEEPTSSSAIGIGKLKTGPEMSDLSPRGTEPPKKVDLEGANPSRKIIDGAAPENSIQMQADGKPPLEISRYSFDEILNHMRVESDKFIDNRNPSNAQPANDAHSLLKLGNEHHFAKDASGGGGTNKISKLKVQNKGCSDVSARTVRETRLNDPVLDPSSSCPDRGDSCMTRVEPPEHMAAEVKTREVAAAKTDNAFQGGSKSSNTALAQLVAGSPENPTSDLRNLTQPPARSRKYGVAMSDAANSSEQNTEGKHRPQKLFVAPNVKPDEPALPQNSELNGSSPYSAIYQSQSSTKPQIFSMIESSNQKFPEEYSVDRSGNSNRIQVNPSLGQKRVVKKVTCNKTEHEVDDPGLYAQGAPTSVGHLFNEPLKYSNSLQPEMANQVGNASTKISETTDGSLSKSMYQLSAFWKLGEMLSPPIPSSLLKSQPKGVNNIGRCDEAVEFRNVCEPSKSNSKSAPQEACGFNDCVPRSKPPFPPIGSPKASGSIDCLPAGKAVFPPPCKLCQPESMKDQDDSCFSKPVFPPPCKSCRPKIMKGLDSCYSSKPVFPPPCKPSHSEIMSEQDVRGFSKPVFPPPCKPCHPENMKEQDVCRFTKQVFPPPCPPGPKSTHQSEEPYYESSLVKFGPPALIDPLCAPPAKSKTHSILDVSALPRPPIPISINCVPKEKPNFPPKCGAKPIVASSSVRQPSSQPMAQKACSSKKPPSCLHKESSVNITHSSVGWFDATRTFFRTKYSSVKSLLANLVSNVLAILKTWADFSRLFRNNSVCSSRQIAQSSFVAHNEPLVAAASKICQCMKRPAETCRPRPKPRSKKVIRVKRVKRTVHDDDHCRQAVFLEEEKRRAGGSKACPGLAYSEVLNIVVNRRNDHPVVEKQRHRSMMN